MSLGLAVVVIAIIALMFLSEKFRKSAFIFLAVTCALIVILLVIWWQQSEREQRLSKQRVGLAEVELLEPQLIRPYSGSYAIQGEIKNLSKRYTVNSFAIELKIYDCPPNYSNLSACELAYTKTDDYVSVRVPPNQRRKFEARFYTSDMPEIKGGLVWQYSVLHVKAN